MNSRKMLASTTGPRLRRELDTLAQSGERDAAIRTWLDRMKPKQRTLVVQVLKDYMGRYDELTNAVNIVLWDMGNGQARVEWSTPSGESSVIE